MLVCASPGWFDDGIGGFRHHVTVPAAFNTVLNVYWNSSIHFYTGSQILPWTKAHVLRPTGSNLSSISRLASRLGLSNT